MPAETLVRPPEQQLVKTEPSLRWVAPCLYVDMKTGRLLDNGPVSKVTLNKVFAALALDCSKPQIFHYQLRLF